MADFQDKVVLITGAGRGLGRALAEAFGARGALVAVNDINPDRASETVGHIQAAGGRAAEFIFDISRKMAVQAMLNEIEDTLGPLDILINSAAVAPRKPLLEMDEWDWRHTLDVNLTAPFLTQQVAGRTMRASGRHGLILHLGAETHPAETQGAYAASKAGLPALARAAARELAPAGIRVYALEFARPDTGIPQSVAEVLHLCRTTTHPSGEIILIR